MEEEFYATLKLVSGEEIFCKICPCPEENRTLLILDNPVTMETINIRQLGMSGLKVEPWIKLTDESMFIMDMENVITMTETKDKELIKIYEKYIKEKVRKTGRSKVTENMGYLSSIADARIKLEKLYKGN